MQPPSNATEKIKYDANQSNVIEMDSLTIEILNRAIQESYTNMPFWMPSNVDMASTDGVFAILLGFFLLGVFSSLMAWGPPDNSIFIRPLALTTALIAFGMFSLICRTSYFAPISSELAKNAEAIFVSEAFLLGRKRSDLDKSLADLLSARRVVERALHETESSRRKSAFAEKLYSR